MDKEIELVKNIEDCSGLVRVAKTDKSDDVRADTVRRITDPTVLAEIAKSDKSDYVMAAADRRLEILRGRAGQKNN